MSVGVRWRQAGTELELMLGMEAEIPTPPSVCPACVDVLTRAF
jgi:hypothetical protein